MITKEQALTAYLGQIAHTNDCRIETGPRGGTKHIIMRARVTGQCKTWKREPTRWRLPMKFGLYKSFSIGEYVDAKETSADPNLWHWESDCPLNM